MRYFTKIAGVQKDLYKALKPLVNQAYNARTKKDMLDWFILHTRRAKVLGPTIEKQVLKSVMGGGSKTDPKALFDMSTNLRKGIDKLPGIQGSAKYFENRSRTYPHLKNIIDEDRGLQRIGIHNN